MRVNKDEGKFEFYTLVKFVNLYFKDISLVVSYVF